MQYPLQGSKHSMIYMNILTYIKLIETPMKRRFTFTPVDHINGCSQIGFTCDAF